MTMKKMLAMVLALVMVLSLAACGAGGAAKMTMGTGGTSGTYYAFGGVLGQYIKNNAGIDVTVVSTDGSKAASRRKARFRRIRFCPTPRPRGSTPATSA